MDTSTNQGLPRMNVRLFLLAAVAVFFGLLWSSDQEYQARELSARGQRKLTAEQPMIAAAPPTIRQEIVASVPVAPFAPSSWIAPSFAPAAEEWIREPVVARKIATPQAAERISQEPSVSMMVVFRRPSLRFDDGWVLDTASRTGAATGWPLFAAKWDALTQWIGKIRFEVAGQTCDMRWQLRRTVPFAGRRLTAFIRRQIGPETDWRILVEKFARGEFGPFDVPATNGTAKHAAAPGQAEER